MRVTSATELASAATTRKAASATQLLESLIVNWPTGGRWKKLNATALSTAVATPSHAPQVTDTTQHRRQVDDRQRDDRRDFRQRVDDQRAQRDRDQRRERTHPPCGGGSAPQKAERPT